MTCFIKPVPIVTRVAIRTSYAVELKNRTAIQCWSPGTGAPIERVFQSLRGSGNLSLVLTGAIFPLSFSQVVDGLGHVVRVELNTESFSCRTLLGCNVDNTVSGASTIKGGSAGSF